MPSAINWSGGMAFWCILILWHLWPSCMPVQKLSKKDTTGTAIFGLLKLLVNIILFAKVLAEVLSCYSDDSLLLIHNLQSIV